MNDSNNIRLRIIGVIVALIVSVAIIAELRAEGIIVIGVLGLGSWLIYRMTTDTGGHRNTSEEKAGVRIQNEGDTERAVLIVAQTHHGTATLAQIVLETSLSSRQADEAIERLQRRGLVRPEIDESGAIIYQFAGLLSHPESSSQSQ